MKIDVAEYISECQRTLKYCTEQEKDIIDLKTSLKTFREEMQLNFVGETGTSIITYLVEVIDPLIQKIENVHMNISRVMKIMCDDMADNFDVDGIIDLDYINGEYLQNFNAYSDEVSQNLYEVNQITKSIADIVDLPKLNDDYPQKLKDDMRREIERVTNLVINLDKKWCQLLTPIDEQIEEIKALLSIIGNNANDPITYQAGSIQLLAMRHGDDTLKTLDDFDTIQEYYAYILERAKDLEKVVKKTIDGVIYYEFNDEFYWENYDSYMAGKIVFLENADGKIELFIIREYEIDGINHQGVAIPFGFFNPDPFQSLFEGNTWNSDNLPALIHFRSTDNVPENIKKHMKELKKIAKYYSKEKNADGLGKLILKYLGNYESNGEKTTFTLEELNEIAGRWSGSDGWRNFGGEIEAHAEMALGTLLVDFLGKRLDCK